MNKSKNWSVEDELKLRDLYINQGIKDPVVIADAFEGKNHRSIISKLVQMQIYIKPEKPTLQTHNTVKALLKRLEETLNIELDGFNLTKKENLKTLVEAIEKKCKQ